MLSSRPALICIKATLSYRGDCVRPSVRMVRLWNHFMHLSELSHSVLR
jgi:hypothetical protein